MDDLVIEVGIPTANNEDTIRETIQSLIDQRRRPDRIIVVDDSSDSTPDIIESIASNTTVPIDLYKQSTKGRGVGGARQDIYEKSHGDILACIDTDNILDETWLAEHAQFHNENDNFGILSNSSGSNRAVTNPKNSDFFGQSNCSITRKALDAVNGWDQCFHRGEDWDMRIRLWRAGVKSFAKREITTAVQQIGTEGEGTLTERSILWAKKKLKAPSSAFFLKKYGIWYLRFHPKHVVGDLLSILSLVSVIVSPLVLFSGRHLIALVLLGLPLLFSGIYGYYKGPRKRSRFSIRKSDITALPIFFILSISFISSLIDLLFNDYDWNYDGFERDMADT